ncbi:unnamed protein product [Caretta caretta]
MTRLVLQEPELWLVLLAYADDVLLVVQEPGDLARVEACQAIYSAASSARVNWVKSSGLAVGDWRQRNAAIEQLEREVLELERRLAASPEDPLLCGVSREKREELRALEDHRAWGAFVRSCIRLLREMDRGSRFFYALEKTRGAKKHITCLLAEEGTPLTEPVEMCRRAQAFYASLFSPDATDPGACRVLWEELPTVNVSNRDQLELPLTLAKFSEFFRRMATNKSPGMDG